MTRQRVYLAITAVTGIALFGWTVVSVGPHELVAQLRALAPVLPLLLALAGVRFLLQAAGWRLAIAADQRPSWTDMFAAVVAGEAAGYFAWGTVSREPMKAWLVSHRLPQRDALAAAVVERTFYTIAATLLILVSIGIVALRYGRLAWFTVAFVMPTGIEFMDALERMMLYVITLKGNRTRKHLWHVGQYSCQFIGRMLFKNKAVGAFVDHHKQSVIYKSTYQVSS